jgi:DNA-binding NarL/FixJ family response regulator
VDATAAERGRDLYTREAWSDAYAALSDADGSRPLAAADLELLATAAYMLGREAEHVDLLERVHAAHLEEGDIPAAVRAALWAGIWLFRGGETSRGGGWLARAQRLLERDGSDCVERGYMLLPAIFEQEGRGDWEAAAAIAGDAVAAAERFRDADLFALAAHERGHILIRRGRLREGLALLDESMVSVTAGELSPIVAGIVYCGVILACQEAHEVKRAGEWTAALTRWCERQPDLVAFTGRCLVHRAEILQLRGSFAHALDEARLAGERGEAAENADAAAEAYYRQGEIHRVLGEDDAAERAYAAASRHGRDPQPGLALLRVAQGKPDAAAIALRNVLGETAALGLRAALLPAAVEIMLAVDDPEAARAACAELEQFAGEDDAGALRAMAAHARAAVALREGDARAALAAARAAARGWRELGAPYEEARARVQVAAASRELGDEDTAALEREAARAVFTELDAAPDLARLDDAAAAERAGGLSDRELEVLRHLAAGETNRAIADELVLSVRTVDRHVSNIFAKLGVSSRAGAVAQAHERRLI